MRTFSDAGPLAALVNKKKGSSSSLLRESPRHGGMLGYSPNAEDEDEDD